MGKIVIIAIAALLIYLRFSNRIFSNREHSEQFQFSGNTNQSLPQRDRE